MRRTVLYAVLLLFFVFIGKGEVYAKGTVAGIENLIVRPVDPQNIQLSWNEAENATEYDIYQKNGKEYDLIDFAHETSWNFEVEPDETYQFRIVPVNDAGDEGEAATTVFTCREKLPAISIKENENGSSMVQIKWKKEKTDALCKVCQLKDGKWREIAKSKQDTVLIKNTTKLRELQLRFYDDAGSMIAMGETFAFSVPGLLKKICTTVISRTKVRLSWDAVSGANAYQIYKKDDKGAVSLIKTVKRTAAEPGMKGVKKFYVRPIYQKGVKVLGKKLGVKIRTGTIVSMSRQKYTYQDMETDIRQLCEKYSEYVRYESIGTSTKGKEIYDVLLGNPDAKHAVLIVAAIHAREYATTVICMKQLEYYLEHFNSKVDGVRPSDIFDQCCLHYIMMANPDGVTISQNSSPRWKANGRGVDLNNNFPYLFVKRGSARNGTSTGSCAGSESETKAIIKISKRLNSEKKLCVLNYHAMGNIVFGSYGGSSRTLRTQIGKMYRIARNTTGYSDAGSYGGKGRGNYREYLMYSLKVPCITIEIGSVSCPLPQYTYSGIFRRNKLVLLRTAAYWKDV